MKSHPSLVVLHDDDEVAIAVETIVRGSDLGGVTAAMEIPRGHKVSRRALVEGAPIRKYGQYIGVATADIGAGELVGENNLGWTAELPRAASVPAAKLRTNAGERTFPGYLRADGSVGTRNYLGVLSSVNCSATATRWIADYFTPERLQDYPNVDGVVAFIHGTGCGMSRAGDGYRNLSNVLRGFMRHPNFGAFLVIGLGCEVMQVGSLSRPGGAEQTTVRFMTLQSEGGTRAAVDKGVAAVKELLPLVNDHRRSPQPVGKLTLALQCGGSDAFSGITCNPALGYASDLLVAHGGASILAETPEICGAEHLLLSRSINPEVAGKLRERVAWWDHYTAINGAEINNNPSPGNKAGGLTTIYEKSLGAVAKSGTSPLVDVLRYGEPLRARGLNFMDSPGFDPVSITGQVASGANLVAFTTGRGSCYGCKPVPSVKLTSNTSVFDRMLPDMDINCGRVLDEGLSPAVMGEEIFEILLRIASGEPTKSEMQGIGDNEFVPWQIGAVL